MKEIVVELENVGVSYKLKRGFMKWSETWPLKDISFKVYRGETLGVIGRNGVGKSTLLRLLAGIVSPDRGKVLNYANNATLLALQAGFIPHLSGRQNAVLSGMLLGLKKKEVIDKMNSIIEFSELEEYIDQPIKSYSTGMKLRLGFSIAMQVEPDLLLIDEVLGVGDEEFKKKSTIEMKRRINSDKTVVIVSHNLPVIRELCDRLVWIENGKVREIGDVGKIVENYRESGITKC